MAKAGHIVIPEKLFLNEALKSITDETKLNELLQKVIDMIMNIFKQLFEKVEQTISSITGLIPSIVANMKKIGESFTNGFSTPEQIPDFISSISELIKNIDSVRSQ